MRTTLAHETIVCRPMGEAQQTSGEEASVAILLATFNGAEFLAEQLASIERQTHGNWCVYASDDGSTDDTLKILAEFRDRRGGDRIRIGNGPQCGHAANFLSLARDREINADYYAFCDQDDVWLEDKLERAIRSFAHLSQEGPALYGSRTIFINRDGVVIGKSSVFNQPPSLENALVQNLAGGNTMLMNSAARDLLRSIKIEYDFYTHDWTLYILVMACGGSAFYDPLPSVNYRQHGKNIFGSNLGISGRINRIWLLFRGQFKTFSDAHVEALEIVRPLLTPGAAQRIAQFNAVRHGSIFKRISNFLAGGFYRQSRLGNLGLWFAVVLRKM